MDSNRKQYKSEQRSQDVHSTASEGLLGNGRRGADAPTVLLASDWVAFLQIFQTKIFKPKRGNCQKICFLLLLRAVKSYILWKLTHKRVRLQSTSVHI